MSHDPTTAHPRPPFSEQEQEPPGREAEMRPLADHGEESYVGHGRLREKVALITGADSGIGRAVALAFAREGWAGPASPASSRRSTCSSPPRTRSTSAAR